MRRASILFAVIVAACGGGSGTATTSTGGATTTTTPTTEATTSTTVVVGTTAVAGQALTADGNVYTIDWDALVGPVFFSPAGGGADPFFHVHNTPADDGFFFSVEAYTVYGPEWTGQLGTFDIDCTATGTGICVHFDPDGPGEAADLGADFLVTGTVEILQADDEGFVAVFSDVAFSDGSTIPGPFTISG